MKHRFAFTAGERRAFELGDELSTVEWCERNIVLPPDITELYGPWHSSVTPYAIEPMNKWDDPRVRRTIKCWAPQTAKTMTSYLPVARRLTRGQGPALLVMSAEAGARKMFKEYVTPIFLASPGVRDLLGTAREDATSCTIRLRGRRGRFDAAWATSLPRLKSFSYRITLGDEVEDWPQDVGGSKERGGGGDPEALLDVRMRFFPHSSRMELVSSPGSESKTWAKMMGCQVVKVYMAVCPHCGTAQRMVWPKKGQEWFPRWAFNPEMDPAKIEGEYLAAYVCAECESHWSDGDRDRAVLDGHWQAVDKRYMGQVPEDEEVEEKKDLLNYPFPPPPSVEPLFPVSIGYHLPAWYSRLVPLAKVVGEFLRAWRERDPVERQNKLKAWRNNYPALPWIEELPPALEDRAILALRDDRPEGLVPPWALGLLLTADVQGDGVWYEVRAWNHLATSALVQYGFIPKGVLAITDPDLKPGAEGGVVLADDLWGLAQLARRTWTKSDGAQLPVRFGLVDSGYRSDEVYDLCRVQKNLAPSKGVDSEAKRSNPLSYSDIDTYPGTKKKIPGGLKLVAFSADVWKDAMSRRLSVLAGAEGSWNLHSGTGLDYIKHLQGETRDPISGKWTQRGHQPNHLLDTGVLQVIAWEILNRPPYNLWRRLAGGGTAATPVQPAPRPAAPAQQQPQFRPTRQQGRTKLW